MHAETIDPAPATPGASAGAYPPGNGVGAELQLRIGDLRHTVNLRLLRPSPPYESEPSALWKGYRITLQDAQPYGVPSAVVLVECLKL